MSQLGPGSILDATKCGSGSSRNTRIWQNLLHHDTLSTIHARLQHTTRPVESALERVGLFQWTTRPSRWPTTGQGELPAPPKDPLPYMGSQLNAAPFRIYKEIPGRGMLYTDNNPTSPSAEVREALMGFRA
jgi:hypothetical protein